MKASEVKSTYTPTKKELTALQRKKGFFTLSGDKVFHTIQGEGNFIGKPVTFVRLHFCNLQCEWCDTPYTWHKGMKEYWQEPEQVSVDGLKGLILTDQTVKGVEEPCRRVCFTGGEPLIQQNEIIEFMKLHPLWEVEIETNGTILPDPYLIANAKFNCSPKLLCSGPANEVLRTYNIDALKAITETTNPCFKFVCKTVDDILEVLDKFDFLPREQIYIMPEGVTKEENTAVYEVIRDAIISEGLSTTPRLQNIMFDGSKRGV